MIRSLWSAVLVLLAVLTSAAAGAQTIPDHLHYWGGGWGWGHMVFGSLMMILFWGGIIVVIVLAVRSRGSGSSHGTTPAISRNKALDILQERFARGEIDKEEFEERKRLLFD